MGNLSESHDDGDDADDDDDDDDDDGGGDIEGGQSVDIVGCCRGGERTIGKSSSHWCVRCSSNSPPNIKWTKLDNFHQPVRGGTSNTN